jgi:hypothetical protein
MHCHFRRRLSALLDSDLKLAVLDAQLADIALVDGLYQLLNLFEFHSVLIDAQWLDFSMAQ